MSCMRYRQTWNEYRKSPQNTYTLRATDYKTLGANKFGGPCVVCGAPVAAGQGSLVAHKQTKKFGTRCKGNCLQRYTTGAWKQTKEQLEKTRTMFLDRLMRLSVLAADHPDLLRQVDRLHQWYETAFMPAVIQTLHDSDFEGPRLPSLQLYQSMLQDLDAPAVTDPPVSGITLYNDVLDAFLSHITDYPKRIKAQDRARDWMTGRSNVAPTGYEDA